MVRLGIWNSKLVKAMRTSGELSSGIGFWYKGISGNYGGNCGKWFQKNLTKVKRLRAWVPFLDSPQLNAPLVWISLHILIVLKYFSCMSGVIILPPLLISFEFYLWFCISPPIYDFHVACSPSELTIYGNWNILNRGVTATCNLHYLS